MLKKILMMGGGLLVLVAIGVGAFFFLGNKGIVTGQQVNLQYWGLWEPKEVIEPLIAEYQKTHKNVNITYTKQYHVQYRERLQAALQKVDGPDIFRFHNTWLPMLKNDLAPLSAGTVEENIYYPTVKKDLVINGTYYGIPLEYDGLVMFYNPDILSAGGVAVPTTWDEFRKAAETLTVKDSLGRIKTSGAALGATGNVDFWSDILVLMMLQNGTDMKKINNTVLPDGANAGVDTLNYYVQFVLGDNKTWDETMGNSTSVFASGKLAFLFGPSWIAHEIKAQNSSLKFFAAQVPQLASPGINWASYWAEGINKKSKGVKEAQEFLKFLAQKENLTKMYTSAGQAPRLFGEPYPRTDMAELVKDDQIVSQLLQEALTAKSWYASSRTFDNGINDRIIKYLEDAVNALLQKKAQAPEALATAAKGIAQVLGEYGF